MDKKIPGVDEVFNPNGAKFTTSGSQEVKAINQRMYFNMLMELALNRFQWEGIPDEIEPTIIEKALLRNGLCVFFHDDNVGPMVALPGTRGGGLDIYGNPRSFTVIGMGGNFSRTMSVEDCVPMYSNMLRTSDMNIIYNYSMILTEISMTIRTNTLQMRTPYIVSASESQRLTAANAMRQVMEGSPALYVEKDFTNMVGMDVFNTSIHPDMVLNSQLYKQKAWNECMTYLGINNANQDKPERLVADEVSANDSQVIACRMSGLKARKAAAERVNERYGTNLSVSWNIDIDAMRDMVVMSDIDNGDSGNGGDDGTIHPATA